MENTSAGTILTLGILSLLGCGVILGPMAWFMGNRSLGLISAGRGNPNDRSVVEAGRRLGILGTILGIFTVFIGATRMMQNL